MVTKGKKKLKKVNTEKKSQILKADRQKRKKRRKYLENLLFVAERWEWQTDVRLGEDLKVKPSTIAKYRYVLGINRDVHTADQSKIDAVKQEYNQIIEYDKQIEKGREKARKDECSILTDKIRKLKKDIENFQEGLIEYTMEERRSIQDEIADLEKKRYKTEIGTVRKYNKKVRTERLRELGYEWRRK